ncbi:RimK family alpha-L-glutamate ligase [Hazenella sp. IB182357]|uniref:RimK family alpha-L-glutamate ligase n=1 Tax=Polycladospora coralii TaxID=2771432 RepID=A0A926NA01_9BACL|nr:RimK family alpha-L-glutamate ligase [Polycladospora coralii]MBD1372533.1 RimK family alpha-L-glutamate ligase [Polycladospora coralii]MBS7531344.1 RimK family alpha-L-glutamate ligase [Polycladospora coralii]
MQGWIIYKESKVNLKPERYEINCLLEEAEQQGIDLKVIEPSQVDLIVTREDRKSIYVDGEPVSLPDFVLPRMGAGTTYFALAVIRHLERLGVPCINSSLSIETVKDKLYTHQILAERNLPVPKTMLAKFPLNVDLIEKQIGFPIVVKTLSGSQGKGVFLSENRNHFDDLMQLVETTNPNFNIILQEFVKTSFGRDLRVFVIGGRVVGCMERNAADDGFKANFSSGGETRAFEATPEIEWLATEATRILGLDIAGVDLLFDDNHFKICEVNSSPGFEGLQAACDVNIPKETFHYLKTRFGLFPERTVKID